MAELFGPTPILRIFDEAKAKEFYLEFLGFEVRFSHRFEDEFPLYMGIARSGCDLHLSEHHGDASPGSHIRIPVDNIDDLSRELSSKNYKYAKPGGAQDTPWGTRELTVTDPFGNRLTFFQSA
jgi:uncharacterized glyoxalase superfamily protein PhnB